MKIVLLLLLVAGILSSRTAFAQSSGDPLTDATQGVENKALSMDKQACRGPGVGFSLSGFPGNQPDNIRCQSIMVAAQACNILASQAGYFLEQVNNGSTTFDAIQQRLDNSASSSDESYPAYVLAKQSPARTNPAQLVKDVFGSCTAMLK